MILSAVRRSLLPEIGAGARIHIALSGGMDSVVLLHALARLRMEQPFYLAAIHVHHGLSPNADHWADFCQSLCDKLDVACHVARVDLADPTGKGTERVAREARYAAFRAYAGDVLCLAHHQNDRAETLLLNLFRGAGVRGLAGAPERRQLEQQLLLRPLIDIPRAELLAWAKQQGFDWIEDESNRDLRFRRNDIRHRVLPAITEAFPGAVQVLARTAGQMYEQSALLDRLAALDASGCRDTAGCISVLRLQPLPEPVVRNIVRWALVNAGWQIPAASRLETLSSQLMSARPGSEVFVRMGTIGIHIWRDRLWVDPAMQQDCPAAQPLGTGVMPWPDGQLEVSALNDGLMVAPVGQGQRFQPIGRCRDTVSELLRARGVPPWVRPRLPAFWQNGVLVWVAELGWAQTTEDALAKSAPTVKWLMAPGVCL